MPWSRQAQLSKVRKTKASIDILDSTKSHQSSPIRLAKAGFVFLQQILSSHPSTPLWRNLALAFSVQAGPAMSKWAQLISCKQLCQKYSPQGECLVSWCLLLDLAMQRYRDREFIEFRRSSKSYIVFRAQFQLIQNLPRDLPWHNTIHKPKDKPYIGRSDICDQFSPAPLPQPQPVLLNKLLQKQCCCDCASESRPRVLHVSKVTLGDKIYIAQVETHRPQLGSVLLRPSK